MRAPAQLAALALVALLAAGSHVHAQQPSTQQAAPSGAPSAAPGEAPAAQGKAQPADAWNFTEDDQAVEGWGQIVRAHSVDLALLTAFIALTLVGFFLKSTRLHTVTLVASVAYVGFYKSSLITVVNVFGLLTWNLPLLRDALPFYFFFGFMLIATVLWGRLYCGRVCAFGAFTQLMDKVVPARLRFDVPKVIDRRASYVKYGLLVAILLVFFVTGNPRLYYRYVEPFWMFSLQASTVEWIGLAVLLVATIFVRNLYCRFLCPLGAFLGLVSNLTVFRIKRWAECKTCKICEKTCEWGAIRGPKIVASECVRCDDCERLYLDQKRCPHWLILKKKGGIAYMTPA